MANLESQFSKSESLSAEKPESQGIQPSISLDSILTAEEKQSIWCALTSLTVYTERRNKNEVGQPLSEFHKGMLSERCAEIDFDKWVREDEANKDENHRAMEILKKKGQTPE